MFYGAFSSSYSQLTEKAEACAAVGVEFLRQSGLLHLALFFLRIPLGFLRIDLRLLFGCFLCLSSDDAIFFCLSRLHIQHGFAVRTKTLGSLFHAFQVVQFQPLLRPFSIEASNESEDHENLVGQSAK